ncbi:hypothetical protein BKA66DRAFT_470221 [Pyrenochaeta sp. MPI-SDFR-AT-0127]|nr:hypothetical protein BKA66DRAFT_470221 [Pyrenochaeta sp. MPI-SDFR-AT-0127]
MLLQEHEQGVFKRWLLPKLETISDADAAVLADYVIALVVINDSEANIKRNCLESLSDFLQDYTEPFVNEVLQALKDKSYAHAPATLKAKGANPQPTPTGTEQQPLPPQTAPIPSIVGNSNSEYEPHPSRATNTPPFGAPTGPAATRATNAHRLPDRPTGPSHTPNIHQDRSNSSRKRKLVERETSQPRDGQDPYHNRTGDGNRPLKQTARRGGRNARGGALEPQNVHAGFAPMPNFPNFANLPPPPPGAPPFDPNNPLAFFAMLAAFGSGLPGMPPLPFAIPQGNGLDQQGPKAKCVDYHTKGFCALGSLCPHEHGDAIAIPVEDVPEYDPEHSFLAVQPYGGANSQRASRAHTRAIKGGRTRASFSLPGPSFDRSNTTLVVEQIPQEHFSDDDVRGFFSQFGTITDLKLHNYKRLAIIKFEDREGADQAYNSPKAVFENRFVKVYWHKSDSETEMGEVDNEEEKLDLEEIAKRQAEAQKAFEKRRKRAEEAAARAEEIDKLLKEKNEEMREIKRQLAILAGDQAGDVNGHMDEDLSQSLATLQAEAEDLFAQHDGTEAPGGGGRGNLRGGYRGRGYSAFQPRGRGYAPFRGTYRGRGAYGAPYQNGRSSVKRLDNRPRRLAVAQIEVDSPRDEALRQYLINIPDCTSIERHPEQPDTLIITFKERYQAEMFLDDSRNIPDVGKLELAWIPNDAFGGIKSSTVTSAADNGNGSDDESSATIEELEKPVGPVEADQQGSGADADMDVADDVDQWM